jgi:hypothetical protein
MAKKSIRAHKKQKAKQAAQLSKIHDALIVAGYDTVTKQAAVLGLSRSAAWAFLHKNKRVGPSNMVIKRILLSKLPRGVRVRILEYIEQKGLGLYGHSERTLRKLHAEFHRESDNDSFEASSDALDEPMAMPEIGRG